MLNLITGTFSFEKNHKVISQHRNIHNCQLNCPFTSLECIENCHNEVTGQRQS